MGLVKRNNSAVQAVQVHQNQKVYRTFGIFFTCYRFNFSEIVAIIIDYLNFYELTTKNWIHSCLKTKHFNSRVCISVLINSDCQME